MKTTTNYGLKKPEPLIDNVDINVLNDNMDSLDLQVKAVADNIPTSASDVGAVPTTRKVNNKALSGDITLAAGDIKATDGTTLETFKTSTETSLADIPKFQTAGGTATAITLTGITLTDGYSKTFIVSANNSGSATTINTKPLYKPNTTTAPNLTAGKAVTVWYNLASDCFFIKASAEGNATTGDVLAGKTFSSDADTGLTGTLALTGNAGVGDVLSGKTFYNTDAKTIQTGTGATAKRKASGTATSGGSTANFVMNNGSTNPAYPLIVSGLTFTPSTIEVYPSAYTGNPDITTYNKNHYYYASGSNYCDIYSPNSSFSGTIPYRNSSPAYVNATGFELPVASAGTSYNWIAYE